METVSPISPALEPLHAPAHLSTEYERALMDLSVTLAHRIRSFVAGIEGYTDMLADTLGTAEQRDMALRILEGAARIERILADLQVFGKAVEPLPMPLSASDLVLEMQRFLDEREADLLVCDVRVPEDHAVMGDPRVLQQALLILLRNAFEATHLRSEVRLTLTASEEGATRFDVWNEGFIDLPDAEARVFTPFYTSKAQNLGIGLPVARRIAEAHGGSLVLAYSTKTEGTCFSLLLPTDDEPFASLLDL